MTDFSAIRALPVWALAAGGGLLGAIIGSFLGAVLERLPQGRSVVSGRSACDHCGRVLGPLDLVPILSFLALRGRCRSCGAAISLWQLACEAGGAVVGAVPWLCGLAPAEAVAAMVLGWVLLLLALLDLRHFWLPLKIVALLALAGAGLAAWKDFPAIVAAGEGAALGLGVLALAAFAYRRVRGREGMGAADPWLLGAIGLWTGPVGVIAVLLGASLVGIGWALAMRLTRRPLAADTPLALGTCLAIAAWPVFLWQAVQ